MVRFQSCLAATAFVLLLGAHLAMALLDAYPANPYLWHVNILYAREAWPLLQAIERLTGGNSAVSVLTLGVLAGLCVLAAIARLRLLAAANCHIALLMLTFLAARSYMRTFPYGLPADDALLSLAARLSVVQLGMAVLIGLLAVACVQSHIEFAGRRRLPSARRPVPGRLLNT